MAHPIVFVRGGEVVERESEMMAVRWRHFRLHHQISSESQREIQPCPHCFSELILG